MNISAISFNQASKVLGLKQTSPAFGMARLTDKGREAADSFGYTHNTYNNSALYQKPGLFKKPAIVQELAKGVPFDQICSDYGCTSNGKGNAEFIRSQILPNKAQKVLSSKVDRDMLENGLVKLYEFNYDNPDLNLDETIQLLKIVQPYIDPGEFTKNIGLLTEGAKKK